jgi:ABC-type transport system involved in cytochrome bd biosynthesis fused ATPase/permease subunit
MVIQALQGFLPPKGGELLVAGRRFDGIRFSSLRNHVAVVGDKLHFGGTVRENLIAVCGRQPDTTELENALQAMHLLETVKALPKGIDSELLPNGFPLSASEATALQMARVLITRPGLVLVTPDFEKMSLDKRKAAKNLLLDRTNDWTVVFFSQRVLKGAFSHYVVAQRDGVHAIPGAESVLQEIEKYE